MYHNLPALCLGGALFLASSCPSPGSAVLDNGVEASVLLPVRAQPAATSSAACPPARRLFFSGDSLARFFRPDAKIIQAQLVGDTLLLVATSDFVYYPFGHCPTIACAKARYAPFVFTAQLPPPKAVVAARLYRGTYQRSTVELALLSHSYPGGQGSRHPEMEVAAGSVQDAGLQLVNGIAVGQPLTQLLPRFFRRPLAPATLATIQVVRLDSGLDRLRHYYTFRQGVLATITFREV